MYLNSFSTHSPTKNKLDFVLYNNIFINGCQHYTYSSEEKSICISTQNKYIDENGHSEITVSNLNTFTYLPL